MAPLYPNIYPNGERRKAQKRSKKAQNALDTEIVSDYIRFRQSSRVRQRHDNAL